MDVFTTPKLDKAIADQIPKNYKKSVENRDKELIKVQQHVLNVGAPLTALHDMLESRQELSHEELLNIVERAICLLGNAENSISVLRRYKILYAVNPAKISLAEPPFPNAGKQLFGNDITKIAADSADIVRNLQKNLNQQHPQTPSWSKPPMRKYQAKNKNFVRLPPTKIVIFNMRKTDVKANNSPFEANKTTAPANGLPSLFYSKLAKYNARSDHFTNCSRFSNSVSKFSCSKNSSPPAVAKLQVDRRGKRDVVAQECNTTGAFQQTRVLPQNVFSCKKGWRSTPSFRPQSFKQIYSDRTLQNGKSHDNKIPHNQRGLYDKYRSDRCISNCTYTPLLTKIPSFFMARSVLPVRNNAFWPQCGTKSIYKVNETRNILASGSGCSHDHLFRRHSGAGPNNRNTEPTRTYHYKSTRVVRISDKLPEVNLGTHTKNLIFGDAHRLLNDGICFAEREKREYPQGVSISFADETAFYQANIAGVGPPGVYSPGHLGCPLALPPSPTAADRITTSIVRLQHSSEPVQRREIRCELVDNQSTIIGGKPYSASDSRLDNFLGCFQNRLGSSLGESSDGKAVEHSQGPRTHQHTGTQGSLFCPEVANEGSESQGDLPQDRQLSCSGLPQQQGGYALQLTLEIWNWCKTKHLYIIAQHVPGKKNVVADEESRKMIDHNEWQLSPTIIQPLIKGCQIDLFVSRLTRQLKSYVSWRPDPGAIHVDAFTMDWRNLRAYAFPPFTLIAAVLHKC